MREPLQFLRKILLSGICLSLVCGGFSLKVWGGPTLESLSREEESFVKELCKVLKAEIDPRFSILNAPEFDKEKKLRRSIEMEPEDLLQDPERDDFLTKDFSSSLEKRLSHLALAPLQKIVTELERILPKIPPKVQIQAKSLAKWYKDFSIQLVKASSVDRAQLLRPKAILFLEGMVPLRIDKQLALELLEKEEHGFTKPIREGQTHHSVVYPAEEAPRQEEEGSARVDSSQNDRFYFKTCLGKAGSFVQIGNEAAVYGLSHLLFGRGITPSLFGILKVSLRDTVDSQNPEEKTIRQSLSRAYLKGQAAQEYFASYPYYKDRLSLCPPEYFPLHISREVKGKTLEEALKQEKDLDQTSYGEMFLLSLLTNPHDWKSNNLVVTDKGEIVGIDNDEAFYSSLYKEAGKWYLGVKNILYALPQREKPLGSILQKFMMYNPDFLLSTWITYLQQRQERWAALHRLGIFKKELYAEQEEGAEQASANLPLRFDSQVFLDIYERFTNLQCIFRDHEEMIGASLLERLDAPLWNIYKDFSFVPQEAKEQIYKFEERELEASISIKERGLKGENLDLSQGKKILENKVQESWKHRPVQFLESFLTHYRTLWRTETLLPQSLSLIHRFIELVPDLKWYLALEHILPPTKGGFSYFEEGDMPIEGALLGKRFIPSRILQEIYEGGYIKRMNKEGRHAVSWFKDTVLGLSLYFKAYPELPGVEMYTTSLTRRLIGYAPYSDLFKIEGKPVLVMQGVEGPSLSSEHLKNLDEETLYERFLAEILLNPEDGKPDNYRLERIPNGKMQIVGIDNDHMLVPAVARQPFLSDARHGGRKKIYVQVKSILFSFDEMNKALSKPVRLRWLEKNLTDPSSVLEEWIESLEVLSERLKALFNKREYKDFLEEHQSFLGVPFRPGVMGMLYTKMVRMKDRLSAGECTPLEVLKHVEPSIARRYVHGRGVTFEERFRDVEGEHYGQKGQTLSTAGVILQAWAIDIKIPFLDLVKRMRHEGVGGALNEVQLQRKKLEEGSKAVSLLESTSVVIENFLKERGIQHLKASEEEEFLRGVGKKKGLLELKDIHTIALIGSKAINYKILRKSSKIYDWERTNEWTHIDLSGSLQVNHEVVSLLAKQCPCLTHVRLQNMPSLEKVRGRQFFENLEWPSIKVLDLRGCQKLIKVYLRASNLEKLYLKGCCSLTDIKEIKIEAPHLKEVDYEIEYGGERYEMLPGIITNPSFKEVWAGAVEGDRMYQKYMGDMFSDGFFSGKKPDYVKAVKWYGKAANQGDDDAQLKIARLYYTGKGVGQNYEKAFEWCHKAAIQGNAEAQVNLGYLYERGYGVSQNYGTALEWYHKAAVQGNATAQSNLGCLHEKGYSVSQNYGTALEWYHKAAAQGAAAAKDNIGWLYALGRGVDKDVEKAKECFLSSSRGSSSYALGILWDKEKNSEKATKFYEQGCKKLDQEEDKLVAIYGLPLMGKIFEKFNNFLNPLTKRLFLKEVELRDEELFLLSSKTFKYLTELDLEKNLLSNQGMKVLKEALSSRFPAINYISLRGNRALTDECARCLAEALRNHPSLISLNMQETGLTDVGREILRDCIRDKKGFSLALDP